MRVLLMTRPNDGILGGDLLQALKTKEALNKIGIEVDIKDVAGTGDYEKYDIVHFFVLNLPNMQEKIRMAKEAGCKIVLSPIYRDKKYGE